MPKNHHDKAATGAGTPCIYASGWGYRCPKSGLLVPEVGVIDAQRFFEEFWKPIDEPDSRYSREYAPPKYIEDIKASENSRFEKAVP